MFKGMDRAAARGRPLSEGERMLVRSVFGEAIDLDATRVFARRFVPLAHRRGLAMAPNGHVYFHPADHREDFSRAGLSQQAWFMHEMTHVWQHQCGACVWLRGLLNRRYGYLPFDPSRPFSSYGVEQQGDIVQDYFTLMRGGPVPGAPPLAAYRALLPFVDPEVAEPPRSVAASAPRPGGATMAKKADSGISTLLRDVRATLGEMFTGGRLDPGQEVNVEVLFAMMGYLARADSIVTSHEAEFVNGLMDELELPTRGRELAMHWFERGRKREIDLDEEMRRFLTAHPKGSEELNHLYDSLLRLAGSDGRLRPGERQFLEKVTAGLGFSVDALDARLEKLVPKPA